MAGFFWYPGKSNFWQVKNSFVTIVNELSVLKLFHLLNSDILFSQLAYSTYKVRKPRMRKLGCPKLGHSTLVCIPVSLGYPETPLVLLSSPRPHLIYQGSLGKPQKKVLFFSGQYTQRGGGKGLSARGKKHFFFTKMVFIFVKSRLFIY